MARISLALAAAAIAATTLGAAAAQAQMSPYGTSQMPPPAYQSAPPAPMQAPSGAYPAQRPPMPMGAAPMHAPMAPPMGAPQATYGGGVVPTPAQPFNNLQLPRQPAVGDGAYGGGGVVLEYLPDGTRRVVQQ